MQRRLPRSDDATEAARAWRAEGRERALQEQNRLLYVAMTRAEDRLYVGGWIGAKKPDRGCWYERIEAGLTASSEGKIFLKARSPVAPKNTSASALSLIPRPFSARRTSDGPESDAFPSGGLDPLRPAQ